LKDRHFRSILDELDSLSVERDKENIIESRATHVISSAINLISYIYENYDSETALELERRLVNSIRGRDHRKFTRKIKQIRESKNENK